jgi:3-hydroxyacyl-CoA dehydrogenase
VTVVLFDLPAEGRAEERHRPEGDRGLKKLNPAPLGHPTTPQFIEAANYEDDLELLRGCDLVIEAIAERMDWKHDLYRKVAPYVGANAIFASNTSGLSIEKLPRSTTPDLKARFCGVHFFNPPRYMHLVELIPTPATDPRSSTARDLPDLDARQGRGAREGHAELHRQPGRHLRHARDDRRGREVRPRLRRGRRPDRREARPREVAAPSAPPTSSAWTRWRT